MQVNMVPVDQAFQEGGSYVCLDDVLQLSLVAPKAAYCIQTGMCARVCIKLLHSGQCVVILPLPSYLAPCCAEPVVANGCL